MEPWCKSCLPKLPRRFGMELSHKSCLAKLSLKLLHGTVVQKLSYKAISLTFACNCRPEAALQNYVLSFCMELSCKSCLAKQFLKLLYGAVVQKMPFETIFAGSCAALSCKSCLLKLLRKLFVWSCHAKVALRGYSSALAWNCRAKAALQSYVPILCMELLGKSCLATRFY